MLGSSRWPGHIKPNTVKNQIFAALDWLPTLVDIAGGPKGDGLKKQIEAGKYAGIVKTTLDGVDQRDYLEGRSDQSARDYFFYFSGATPSAVRYKNWKMYYTMSQPGPAGWIMPLIPFHFTLVNNIKRDPFEQAVGIDQKTAMSMGGALGAPMTAFLYDWNMLPIGQQLWERHLLSYEKFPPLQAATAQKAKPAVGPSFSFAVYGDSRSMMYLPYRSDQEADARQLMVDIFSLVLPERVSEEMVKKDVKLIYDPATKELTQIVMP